MLIVLCLTLCSCSELDELRSSISRYSGDGTITFDGATYVELRDVPMNSVGLIDGENIYLARNDLPTLLVPFFGTMSPRVSTDKSVISHGSLYVREDKKTEIENTLASDFTSYSAFYYDENAMKYAHNVLPKEFADAINETLATAAEEEFSKVERFITELYACDDTGTFSKATYLLYVDSSGKYFICTDGKDGNEVKKLIPDNYQLLIHSYSTLF